MSTPTIPEPEAPERDAVAEMRAALRKHGWSPERQAVLKAAHREMRQQYGRMYVAYREVWDGDNLVEPLVVAASPDEIEIERLIEALPAEKRTGIVIDYVRPPGVVMAY